jgi:transcriptional regulator with XRE-family HTH domain
MTLFERIKITAKKQGLSLQDTALKASLSINTIYGWKTKTPSSESIQAVADALHVTTDYLLGNTDDPAPAPKAGKPNIVDLKEANVFMYEGDRADVDGLDPEDWAIMKAIFDKARKSRKNGK